MAHGLERLTFDQPFFGRHNSVVYVHSDELSSGDGGDPQGG